MAWHFLLPPSSLYLHSLYRRVLSTSSHLFPFYSTSFPLVYVTAFTIWERERQLNITHTKYILCFFMILSECGSCTRPRHGAHIIRIIQFISLEFILIFLIIWWFLRIFPEIRNAIHTNISTENFEEYPLVCEIFAGIHWYSMYPRYLRVLLGLRGILGMYCMFGIYCYVFVF